MEETPEGKDIAILNSKDRLFGSWATVEIRDKQGELIPISAFIKTMPTMLKRQAPILIKHTNKIVGKLINAEVKKNAKYDSDGIFITGLIYNDYKLEDDTWSKIKEGVYTGISVGGQQSQPGANGEVIWIEPCEFSLTENPANPGALIEAVAMAKESNPTRETPEWKKERQEHPEFTDEQIDKIVDDHAKNKADEKKEVTAMTDEPKKDEKPEVPAEKAVERPAEAPVEAKPAEEKKAEEVSDEGIDRQIIKEIASLVETQQKILEMLSAAAPVAKEAPKEEEKKPEDAEKCNKEMSKEAVSTSIVPRPEANQPYTPKEDMKKEVSAADIALGKVTISTRETMRYL